MQFSNDNKVDIKRDFPRGRPENQLPVYLQCLKEKKAIKYLSIFITHHWTTKLTNKNHRRQPPWDAPPAQVTLEIAKVQAEIKEAEDKLNEVHATKKTKQKVLDEQWADLERKEEEFKKAFIKYNEVGICVFSLSQAVIVWQFLGWRPVKVTHAVK